jgi:MFS family permease
MDKKEHERGMKYAVYEGVLASAMFAITSTFLTLFALHLGADNTTIGMVISIPASVALLMYIPAAYLIEKTNKRRIIATIASFISKSLWILVALVPIIFQGDLFWLIIILSLSSIIGAFVPPTWASLIGDIVPENKRGRYFSKRNRLCAASSLITITLAGILMDIIDKQTGFVILFILAGIFGISSSFTLFKFPETKSTVKVVENLKEELKRILSNSSFKRFVLILFIWQFGVSLASPFFNVHLIKNLQADYVWVSMLMFASGIAGILINRFWGNISDIFGHRIVIIMSAFGASFIPFLWFFAPSPHYLIPIAALAGASWAGMNLANFNYLLDLSKEGRRAIYSAFFWTVLGLPMISAPILGGIIADYSAKTLWMFGGLKIVFIISWIIRLFAFALFLKFLKDIPPRKTVPTRYVVQEIINIGISYFSGPFTFLKRSSYVMAKKTLLSIGNNIRKLKKWKMPKEIKLEIKIIENEIAKIEKEEHANIENKVERIKTRFRRILKKVKINKKEAK